MTDADFLWKLIAGLSLLANFFAGLVLVYNRLSGSSEAREIKNDPLNVREADRFVTEKEIQPIKAHLDKHNQEIDGLRRELQANYNAIMKSEAEGRSRLHKEINEISKDMSACKASLATLEGLPERLSRDIGILFGTLQKRD